jgi:hypothetical protein
MSAPISHASLSRVVFKPIYLAPVLGALGVALGALAVWCACGRRRRRARGADDFRAGPAYAYDATKGDDAPAEFLRARRPAYTRVRGRQSAPTRSHRAQSRSGGCGAHSSKNAEGAPAAVHTPAARYRARPCSSVGSTSRAMSGTHAGLAPRRGSPAGAIASPPLLGRAHLTSETDSSASASVHDGVRKPSKVDEIVERLGASDRGGRLSCLIYQPL